MDRPRFQEFTTGAKRALIFLNLAIEQYRLVDDEKADTIYEAHFRPLQEFFYEAINFTRQNDLPALSRRDARELFDAGANIFSDLMEDVKLAPPGLGRGVFPEEKPKIFVAAKPTNTTVFAKSESGSGQVTPKASQYQGRADSVSTSSASSHAYPDDGIIDSKDPSSTSASSLGPAMIASALSVLVDGSEPVFDGPGSERSCKQESIGSSRASAVRPRLTLNGVPMVDPIIAYPWNPVRAAGHEDRVYARSSWDVPVQQSPRLGTKEPNTAHALPVSDTPSAIEEATTAHAPDQPTEQQPPHRHTWAAVAALAPSPAQAAPSTTPRTPPAATLPYETPAHQDRVVWLHPLPASTTAQQISALIHEGPVYSLLLTHNKHATLPGLSACIIFLDARSTTSLLASFATRGFPPATTARKGAALRASAPLLAMRNYPFARRRLKWSRARLFHDVPLRAFKTLVLRLAGGAKNVELLHFYNAGEATAVFASVCVASAVREGFRALARGEGDGEMEVAGVDGVDAGFWAQVDVAFVPDFNEKPAPLFSQYGTKSFRHGHKGTGLFEGPEVSDEEVFGKV